MIVYEFAPDKEVEVKVLPIVDKNTEVPVGTDVCVNLNGRFYRSTKGDVFFCANSNSWRKVSGGTVHDSKVDKYFNFDPFQNIRAVSKDVTGKMSCSYFINESNAASAGFVNHSKLHNIMCTKQLSNTLSDMLVSYDSMDRIQPTHYKVDFAIGFHKLVKEAAEAHMRSKDYSSTNEVLNSIGDMFHQIGVELELSSYEGPTRYIAKHFLIPVRDGSLPGSGLEVCTPPLRGGVGIEMIRDAVRFLKPHSSVSSRCSLHLHFDISSFNKKELVALYTLYMRIQDEILELMPVYISNQVSIARKSRDYSARLQPIGIPTALVKRVPDEQEIERLYKTIKEVYTWKDAQDLTKLPWESSPWLCASRYVALNLVPFFTGKSTCEFRAHPPTLSYTEILDWVATCAAIIKFSKSSTDFILNSYANGQKLTLLTVISQIENSALREHLLSTVDKKVAIRTAQLLAATSDANISAGGVEERNKKLMRIYEQEFGGKAATEAPLYS